MHGGWKNLNNKQDTSFIRYLGLVLEFEMWRHFDTKKKSKSFTFCNCVWLHWLCVILWFTLTLNFWYLKLKTDSFNVCFKKIWTNCSSDTILQFVQVFLKQTLFSEDMGWFFFILCYLSCKAFATNSLK